MTSLFKGRTSTDSQRPQSRRSLKSRLSFSAQSKENILEALPAEDVPPVPPLPVTETRDTKEDVSEKAPAPAEPAPSAEAVQQTPASAPPETKGESVMPSPSTDKPLPIPAVPSPAEPVVKKSRHSRHDSAMQAPSPPKRSSSFKTVLNTYYKIFGGSPKKTPKHEKLPEEAERLRKLVKKYEAQLEEASNILLLQDKVIARWEKDAASKGTPVTEVTSNGVSAIVPVEAPVAKAVEPLSEQSTSEAKAVDDVPEGSRSLGLIRESSKEILSEIAVQQAKDAEPNQEATPTIRLVEDDLDKANELESTKRDLAAAQAAADGYAKRYHDLEKTAEQSSAALVEVNSAKDKLEGELAVLKAELDTTKRTQEEPTGAGTSIFDGERSALKSRIEELELQLSAANTSLEVQTRDHEEHKISLAKELETAHASKAASASDVERLTASLGELRKSHDNVSTEHESTKSSLAAQLALVAAHEASLKQKDDDWNGFTQSHEKELAESTSQLDAATSRLQALTTEHEALQSKHTEAISALESAKSEASAAGKTLSGEHQAALAALTKDLDASKAQLEESNTLAENMKKEHADVFAALNAELEVQRSSLDKVTRDAKGHEDRALNLDEELQYARTAHKGSEDAHLATKAELDSLVADKTGLEAKLAAFTTASVAHEAQLAELEKVNKELAKLRLELEGHATTKSDLEAKIAALEGDAEGHATTQSDLQTSQAKITDLESQVEGHATSRAELEAKIAGLEDAIGKHRTNGTELQTKIAELESSATGHATAKSELESKIAALQADAETHASTVSDLEISQARAAELEGQVEKHEATRAELDAAQAHIAELKTVSEAHEVQKTELADARAQVEGLYKDIEAHEIVKKDLSTAQTQIADLEKSLESGKADHATIAEKLSSVEASLATTTVDHEKLRGSLSEKESALQEALKGLETQKSQLSEKATALNEAQEALEKAKAEASQASTLTKDLKAAEEKVSALEQELVSSNEKHEAEKASLSSKVKDIWKLREQNDLLQQQLAAAQESERTAKSSVTKLEADLRSAKDVQLVSAHEDGKEDDESSGLGKAALAVGALGAVGAGAFGVSKFLDDDVEDKPISKDNTESIALPEALSAEQVSKALSSQQLLEKDLDTEKPDIREAIDEQSNDGRPIDKELSRVKAIDEEPIEPVHQDSVQSDAVKQESTEQGSTVDQAVVEQPVVEQLTEDASVEKKSLSEGKSAQHVIPGDSVSDEPTTAPQVDETSGVEAPANSDVLPEDPVAKAVVDEDEPSLGAGLTKEPVAKEVDVDTKEQIAPGDDLTEPSAEPPHKASEDANAKPLLVDTEAPSVEIGKDGDESAPVEPPSAIGFTPIEPYPESAVDASVSTLPPVEEALVEEDGDEKVDSTEAVGGESQDESSKDERPTTPESQLLNTRPKLETVELEQTADGETSKAGLITEETETSTAKTDELLPKVEDSARDVSSPLDEVSKPVNDLPQVEQNIEPHADNAYAIPAVDSFVNEQEIEVLAEKIDSTEIEPESGEQLAAIPEPKATAIAAGSTHHETPSGTDESDTISSKETSNDVAESATSPLTSDQIDKDGALYEALAEAASVEKDAQPSTSDEAIKGVDIPDIDAPQAEASASVQESKVASDGLDEPRPKTSPQHESAAEEEEANKPQVGSGTVLDPLESTTADDAAQIKNVEPTSELGKDFDAVSGSPLAVANSEQPETAKSEDSQSEVRRHGDDELAATSEAVSTPEKAVESENVTTSEPIDKSEPAKEPTKALSVGHDDKSDELLGHVPADEIPASLHEDHLPAETANSGTKTEVDASTILVPLPGETAAVLAESLPRDHEVEISAIDSIPRSDPSEHSFKKNDIEAESVPSASEPNDQAVGPTTTDDDVETPNTIGPETPKIKCLTCGDDIDMDGLAEHFCAPTASPLEITEAANPPADAHIDGLATNVVADRDVDDDSAIEVLAAQPSSTSADQGIRAMSTSPIDEQSADDKAVPLAVSDFDAVRDSVDTASAAKAAEDTSEPLANGVSNESVLSSVDSVDFVVGTSSAPVSSRLIDKDAEEIEVAIQDEGLPTAGESAASSTGVASTDATSDVDDLKYLDALKTPALPVEDSTTENDTKSERAEDTDANSEVLSESSKRFKGIADVGDDATIKVDHMPTENHLPHTDNKFASEESPQLGAIPKDVVDVAAGTPETPEPRDGNEDLTEPHNIVEAKTDQELERDEHDSTPTSQPEPEATGKGDGQEIPEVKGEQTTTTSSNELDTPAKEARPKLVPTPVIDDEETPKVPSTITSVQPVTEDPATVDEAANGDATPGDFAIQQSPASPQTPSKRKSVRWEDIENSKQSTPVEELEKQLDAPLVNGDHANTTAEKHSVGPELPADELQGLAISDVPLSQEPDAILEDDKTSVYVTPLSEQATSVEEQVTSNKAESVSRGPEEVDDPSDAGLQAAIKAPETAQDDLDPPSVASVNHASAEACRPEPTDTTGQSDIESEVTTSTTEEEHTHKVAETKEDVSKTESKVGHILETSAIGANSWKKPKICGTDVDSEPLDHDAGSVTAPLLSETDTQVKEGVIPSLDSQKLSVGSEIPNLDLSREEKEVRLGAKSMSDSDTTMQNAPISSEDDVEALDVGKDELEGEDDNEAAPGLGQKLAAKTSDLVSVVKDKINAQQG